MSKRRRRRSRWQEDDDDDVEQEIVDDDPPTPKREVEDDSGEVITIILSASTDAFNDEAIVFIHLHPEILIGWNQLLPVGDECYFNLNRVGYARFRPVRASDHAGLATAASKVPLGSPMVEISLLGDLHEGPSMRLFYPGAVLSSEYERLRVLLRSRAG